MKRLIIAIILLIIIIVILVIGNRCILNTVEQMEVYLDKAYQNYESKDYDSCIANTLKLEEHWIKKEGVLSLFVNKAIIEEIGVCVAQIKSLAKYKNDDFYSECDTLYVLLKHMRNDENFPF